MKKIVVFTGAGISRESGIPTFRDYDGLWEGFDPQLYASIRGWNLNRDKMNEFYNQRRSDLEKVKPNSAHKYLAKLEKDFDVNIITQNVDDLHERAGSTKIIHLHGELTKVRMADNMNTIEDIGYKPLDIEERKNYRPHVIWFGENVPKMDEAYSIVQDCDYLIVIGTSLQVYPAANIINIVPDKTKVIYIDPKAYEMNSEDNLYYSGGSYDNVIKISKTATEGVKELRYYIYE